MTKNVVQGFHVVETVQAFFVRSTGIKCSLKKSMTLLSFHHKLYNLLYNLLGHRLLELTFEVPSYNINQSSFFYYLQIYFFELSFCIFSSINFYLRSTLDVVPVPV